MKHAGWVFGAVIGTGLLFPYAVSPAFAESQPEIRDIGGRYRSMGDSTTAVTLRALAIGVYHAVGDGWEGAGLFDGTTYWGVFRRGRGPGQEPDGTHRGMLKPDGTLAVHGEFVGGRGKAFDVVWSPERRSPPPSRSGLPVPTFEQPVWPPRNQAPNPDGLPAPGDYVQVDELPEALTKVAPVYPDAARAAKVEGTVLVQALVGKDGRVLDTRIVKSIPGLDEAAMSAVRQWVFKPATAGGKPVAVWVAVPINFSLH